MKKKISLGAVAAGVFAGGMIGFLIEMKGANKIIHDKDERINKFVKYFHVFDVWMGLREEGKSVKTFFEVNGYNKVAIYGIGRLGEHLIKELEGMPVEISYAIDRKGNQAVTRLDVYTMEDDFPDADVIVVTAVFDYDNIKRELIGKTTIPIVSLEDVIYESI